MFAAFHPLSTWLVVHSLAMVHPIIEGHSNEPNVFNKPCGNLVACTVRDSSTLKGGSMCFQDQLESDIWFLVFMKDSWSRIIGAKLKDEFVWLDLLYKVVTFL